MPLIKSETWRTSNARNVGYSDNHHKLVMLAPKRDRLDTEAKFLNMVRIHWLYGLCFLVDGIGVLNGLVHNMCVDCLIRFNQCFK